MVKKTFQEAGQGLASVADLASVAGISAGVLDDISAGIVDGTPTSVVDMLVQWMVYLLRRPSSRPGPSSRSGLNRKSGLSVVDDISAMQT